MYMYAMNGGGCQKCPMCRGNDELSIDTKNKISEHHLRHECTQNCEIENKIATQDTHGTLAFTKKDESVEVTILVYYKFWLYYLDFIRSMYYLFYILDLQDYLASSYHNENIMDMPHIQRVD